MKKKVLIAMTAVAALCLASCDTKLCYCYEPTATGTVEQTVYANPDTPCASLGSGNRGCVERNERMDPDEIIYSPEI